MKEKKARHRVLIKKSFQLKYAAIVFLAVLITAVTVGGDFYYSLHSFLKEYLSEIPQFDVLLESMNQLIYAKIIVLLIIAVGVSLLISHKFAGPMFNLEKSLMRLHTGDLTKRMYLRAGDELKHLSDYYNKIINRFTGWIKRDREIKKEVIEELEELKIKADSRETRQKIEDLQNKLHEISSNWKIEE